MKTAASRLTTLLLLLNAMVFCYAAYRSLFYLGDVTVPEGSAVYSVKGLLTGEWPLYHDYTLPPYSITPYTPLFYLASAVLAWGTTKSIYAIYICCRLLTFAATLGSAFFVQKIVRELKPDTDSALAFLLPFTILTLVAWGFAARPDMLAIMLSLAGIYIYLRNPQSLANLFYSALILALSWWCKQSFIAAPAALFLALLCAKKWQRSGIFLLVYIAAVVTLFGITDYLSHGWFYNNIITANVTKLQISQVYDLTIRGYFYLAPFITVAALLGVYVYFKSIISEPKLRCIALYLLTSVALSMAASMKEGAYFNYMIESLFVASIVATIAIIWLQKYTYMALATPLLLVASLAFSYHFYWYCDGALENALGADIAQENTEIQSIIDKINGLSGDVLTSKSALAVRSSKPVLATDLFNVRYLEQEGKLSTQILADRIQHQELAAIVSPEGCQPSTVDCKYWPGHMRKAILEKYEPRETLYHYVFWYPKGK